MLRQLLAPLYHKLPIIRELDRVFVRLGNLQYALTTQSSIAARQFLAFQQANDPRYADPKRLLQYFFQVCSQGGEDGILQEIFRRIGTESRVFVESGVGDGRENNTAFLLSLGWTGFWVDASPKFLPALQHARLGNEGCLRHAIESLTRENAVEVMTRLGVPTELDLLSLDIDQNTYYVWEALGARFKPRVVVVEYNGIVPPQVEWVSEYDASRVWNGSHNYGASLKSLELLGRRMGYELVGCDPFGTDAFFVRAELVGDEFHAPFTAENHFEPARFHLIHRMGMYSEILDRKRP